MDPLNDFETVCRVFKHQACTEAPVSGMSLFNWSIPQLADSDRMPGRRINAQAIFTYLEWRSAWNNFTNEGLNEFRRALWMGN